MSASHWRAILRLVVLGVLVVAGLPRSAAAGPRDNMRLALVIGNGDYRAGRLDTATNDAGLVAQGLAQIGFDVTAMGDVDAATLRKTVQTFLGKIREAGGGATIFVYLTGQGVQYAGANFVVPVDARIVHQTDIPGAAVPLAEIQDAIEALPARARVFVYDLAHPNALATGDRLPLAAGLTPRHPPKGSLHAFNAAPGAVARVADLPPYGLYARALAEILRTPGLTAEEAFSRVRLRVAEVTNMADIPWDESALDPDVTLLPADANPPRPPPPGSIAGQQEEAAVWTALADDRLATYQEFSRAYPTDPLAIRMKDAAALRLEAMTWSESVRVDTPAAYWTYMERYPRGPHYVDVRRRLAAIRAPLEPPSRFDLFAFANLPAPSADEVRRVDPNKASRDDLDAVPIARPPDALLPPAPAAVAFELAPPLLVPQGTLPIPPPLPPVSVQAWPERPGRIDQPFVPGLGLVSTETASVDDGAATTVSTDAGLITRATTKVETGQRTILQTDAANEIVSRTSVTRHDATLTTIAQTGFDGALLSRIVIHVDPLGERLTTISDGGGRLVAEIRADRWGVVRDVERGTATLGDSRFALSPLESLSPAVSPDTATPAAPALTLDAPMLPEGPPPMPAMESADTPAPAPAVGQATHDVTPSPPPSIAAAPVPPAAAPVAQAAVPLPVPRPPQASLTPRRSAAPGRTRH